MPQFTIDVTQSFATGAAEVFAALADHNRLGRILGAPVRRIRDGQGDVNGVGSIRRIGPWPLGTQETVTEFAPGKLIAYRISRLGGPVVNHRGRLDFAPDGDGCRVTWHIEFDTMPAVIGPMLRNVLEGAVRRGLSRLAAQDI